MATWHVAYLGKVYWYPRFHEKHVGETVRIIQSEIAYRASSKPRKTYAEILAIEATHQREVKRASLENEFRETEAEDALDTGPGDNIQRRTDAGWRDAPRPTCFQTEFAARYRDEDGFHPR
jgi:hypothetical protein